MLPMYTRPGGASSTSGAERGGEEAAGQGSQECPSVHKGSTSSAPEISIATRWRITDSRPAGLAAPVVAAPRAQFPLWPLGYQLVAARRRSRIARSRTSIGSEAKDSRSPDLQFCVCRAAGRRTAASGKFPDPRKEE